MEKLVGAGQNIDDSVDKALMAGAPLIQDEMLARVPFSTGNLAEHIAIKGPERDGNFHSVEVGIIHDINFTDEDTARYGNAQEYGTSTMEAQPFIRPGMDNGKGKANKAMKESLMKDGAI